MYNDFFRPIHYLGSKLRIVDFIRSTINSVDNTSSTVLDLFSGSGTVAKYLSYERPVIASDIQNYSTIINSALLLPLTRSINIEKILSDISSIYQAKLESLYLLIEYEEKSLASITNGCYDQICEIMSLGSISTSSQTSIKNDNGLYQAISVFKHFSSEFTNSIIITYLYGGVFFSYKQALYLDSCLSYLDQCNPADSKIIHASILSTASDLVNSIGKQFAQPLNPKDKDGNVKTNLMKKIFNERTRSADATFSSWLQKYCSLQKPRFNNKVIQGNCFDVLKNVENVGVIYADPPYTRYHYSRYYHVLETIALRDLPSISYTNLVNKRSSKGVYRTDRYQSPFGIKSLSYNAFTKLSEMTSKLNCSLVLSYSPYDNSKNVTPRIISIDTLTSIVSLFYNNVDTLSCGDFTHSKLNKSDLLLEASDHSELLIIGTKPKVKP